MSDFWSSLSSSMTTNSALASQAVALLQQTRTAVRQTASKTGAVVKDLANKVSQQLQVEQQNPQRDDASDNAEGGWIEVEQAAEPEVDDTSPVVLLPEIIHHVCSYLGPRDLACSASLVNR